MERMKRFAFIFKMAILLCLMSNIAGCGQSPAQVPPPLNQGQLDLTTWNFEQDGLIALNGEWEFYWFLLLPPQLRIPTTVTPTYVTVPSAWTHYQVQEQPLPGLGYGTFRLLIKIPQPNKQYGLKLVDTGTAYRLWVDNQVVATTGIVGTNHKTSIPSNQRQTVFFTPQEKTIEIVMEISNFHHRHGGIWHSIQFGLAEDIQAQQEKQLAFDFFLFGSLLIIGVYHLGLYLFRRQDSYTLYFGLFCLLTALRAVITGENYLFNELSWAVLIKVEYLTYYLVIPIFVIFFQRLYPDQFFKQIVVVVVIIGVLFSGLVITTPPLLFSQSLPYYQFITIVIGIYLIVGLGKAIKARQEGAIFIGVGFLILLSVVINDILYANKIIQTGAVAPIGMIIFVFMQSLALSVKLSKTFARAEALSEKLAELHQQLASVNADLEQKVARRTQVLLQTNQHLHQEIVDRKEAQQKNAVFAQVVEHVGYALLDENLTVLSSNQLFNRWVEGQPASIVGQPITDHVMELFGFEESLQQLFQQPTERITLSRINRPSEREQGDFFTLEFELLHASQNILLALAIDDTAHAYLEGHLKQERNELKLNIIQREKAEKALEKRIEELSTLNLINQTISTVLDLDVVLSEVAQQMTQIFNARSSGIALFNNKAHSELKVVAYYTQDPDDSSALGVTIPVKDNPSTEYVLKTRQTLSITDPQTNPLTAPLHGLMRQRNTKGLLITPLISRGELFGTIGIDTNQASYKFTDSNITLAETITGQIAGVIDNTRLFKEIQQANKHMQTELNLARQMQYSLLPPPRFKDEQITIVCEMAPARQVGGDFYYYTRSNNNNITKYGLAVGDVSGKGVSAALLMAISLSQLDSHLAKNVPLTEMLSLLDEAIMPYTKPRKHNCALSYIELEVRNGKLNVDPEDNLSVDAYALLRVVNAGCIPPYVKRANGLVEFKEIGGFALGQGLGAIMGYQQHTIELMPGDLVILTSDGVVEANNEADEMLGFERLMEIVQAGPTNSAADMLTHLKQTVFSFTESTEQHDDMTMIVIQV